MTWHRIEQMAEATYRIYEPMGAIMPSLGISSVNAYLVVGDDRAALIDSGMGVGRVRDVVESVTCLPCEVLNTHYHWDHVGGNAQFAESGIHELEAMYLGRGQPLGSFRDAFRHPADPSVLPESFDVEAYRIVTDPATRTMREGDVIDLGGRALEVLHTPGHSPGHITYLDRARGLLFTGDTAYDGPVYACFEGGDPQAFARSAARLAALEGPLTVCPGHGDCIADPTWLGWYAQCVGDAVAGRSPGELKQGLVLGREHRFGRLAVWLPAQAEPGP